MNNYSRYERQINLIGNHGQDKFSQISILCVGAGGLGTLVCSYLIAAGVGALTIADGDNIELSNLTRQISYKETQCGLNKALVLGDFLKGINSNSKINTYPLFIDYTNETIISDHDLVLDCSDNFKTRYLLSDICSNNKVPLVSASVDGFLGQVIVFNSQVCYRCLFPELESQNSSCYNGDVVGPAVAIIASTQANETFKLITGINISNRLIQIDTLNNNVKNLSLTADLNCLNQHYELQVENKQVRYITPNELVLLQQKESVIILNLNNKVNINTEKQTYNINLNNFMDVIKYINQNQTIAVICNYGFKSKHVAICLEHAGYTNIYYSSNL